VATVHVSYYTDPACPWSWSIEPALRRLEMEFGAQVEFTYVMGGLAREFGAPLAQVAEWLDAAEAGGMPVDPRLWIESPPASSYPACLAVKAAGEQGREVAGRYLRRLREGIAYGRRRLDRADALLAEARGLVGLDLQRFEIDLQSNWMAELFAADLDRAGAVDAAHHASGTGRVRLPSLEFRGEDSAVHGVYGPASYEALREAVEAAGGNRAGDPPPDVEAALRRFGTLATAEVAAVCDLPGPRAAAELWRLAGEWRVRADARLTGEMWSLA